MQLRTFRARTLPEAMRRLRAELGEDAVIVASRELDEGVQGGFKRSSQHGLFRLIVGTGPGPQREFSSPASFEVCR
jgi:flagellar biosynthesis GTPase FlhF